MIDFAKTKNHTYIDYMNYSENTRIEIINGQIYAMAPSPSRVHQEIVMELSTIINNYIKSNKSNCKVYSSPFDVFLVNKESIDECKNIVQPDISVICDKNKLTDKGCIGSPDLIIEVVSPYNPSSDYVRKLNLYEYYKVKEYIIINPMKESILYYKLDKDMQYLAPDSYTFKNALNLTIFKDLEIDFSNLNLL